MATPRTRDRHIFYIVQFLYFYIYHYPENMHYSIEIYKNEPEKDSWYPLYFGIPSCCRLQHFIPKLGQ